MSAQTPPIVCAISASDSSGHAGHQCDLRVIQDLDCHGVSVLSGLTAQNSQTITAVESPQHSTFVAQLEALLTDLPLAAIKTGLILSAEQLDTLSKKLSRQSIPLIVDPVLSTTSGKNFDSPALIERYRQLLSITDLLTPNIPETQLLLDRTIISDDDIIAAACSFRQLGARAVLIKGGHRDTSDFVYDYFDDGKHQFWLQQQRQDSNHTRGTGCVLASAAASFIAQNKTPVDAVILASAYLQQGIRHGFALGQGNGLLGNKGWPQQLQDYPEIASAFDQFDHSEFPSCGTKELGLYPIVDSLEWLRRLLELGVTTLQLRIKHLSGDQLETVIHDSIHLGQQYQARVFINDHWQLAIEHQAYGVHLGQEDMNDEALAAIQRAGLRLGLSSHSEYEWIRAASVRPSYIAMGSVFTTQTKTVKTIGLTNLQRWTEVLNDSFATVAIGGITEDNIDSVINSGVGSCAVISTITGSADYQTVTSTLMKKLETRN
jgi:hydroxymethylpyrimidine kinase / phosphomethylpyrimidine kinase / thiamine-phosphate diphosphorylase